MPSYYLPNPEYFLLVAKDQIALPSPDQIEYRHYPEPVDWSAVARTVSDLGKRLVMGTLGNGKWDEEGYCEFEINDPSLGKEELRIIGQWFGLAQGPRVDAKNSSVENGRHRLTYCWTAEPSLQLPVICEFFANVDEIPHTKGIEKYIQEDAEYIIKNFSEDLLDANPIFKAKVKEYIEGKYDLNREFRAKIGD